jgi:hypothetical protein
LKRRPPIVFAYLKHVDADDDGDVQSLYAVISAMAYEATKVVNASE